MSSSAPKLFAFLIIFFIAQVTAAQNSYPDQRYKLIASDNFVQSKNYYLLNLFKEIPELKKMLGNDAVLGRLGAARLDSIRFALKNCQRDGLCYTRALRFSEAEIVAIGARLKELYQPSNALGRLVRDQLLPSGAYILYQQLPAADMLVKAWEQDAEGVNFAISVYAEGGKPNYPNIDSISFTTRDPRNNQNFLPGYASLLYNASFLLVRENEEAPTFFEPSLSAALRFIEINEREQAADFEPLTAGENKAALARIPSIKWTDYKYSVILLPGAGPEDPAVPLSAEGMIRCRLAAMQYHKGVAPFIIPSGGKVHPYKTKYCEALEMKKYLVEKLKVPASAVIIEPHARHTTTNMRNAARLIYRYGIPFDKAAITCTTRGQSAMIEKTLIDRCKRELNEVPYRNGVRLSETEMEFYPLIEALHINPKEPMDP